MNEFILFKHNKLFESEGKMDTESMCEVFDFLVDSLPSRHHLEASAQSFSDVSTSHEDLTGNNNVRVGFDKDSNLTTKVHGVGEIYTRSVSSSEVSSSVVRFGRMVRT